MCHMCESVPPGRQLKQRLLDAETELRQKGADPRLAGFMHKYGARRYGEHRQGPGDSVDLLVRKVRALEEELRAHHREFLKQLMIQQAIRNRGGVSEG